MECCCTDLQHNKLESSDSYHRSWLATKRRSKKNAVGPPREAKGEEAALRRRWFCCCCCCCDSHRFRDARFGHSALIRPRIRNKFSPQSSGSHSISSLSLGLDGPRCRKATISCNNSSPDRAFARLNRPLARSLTHSDSLSIHLEALCEYNKLIK